MRHWRATIKVGVFWDGPEYLLATGPRWWVDLRARLHLWRYPYRRAWIIPTDREGVV